MSCNSRIGPLTAHQARTSLAHRLTARVDRLRQRLTSAGLRSDRVFLVWTTFSGAHRGEGEETEVARVELLPTPRVSDMTAVNFNPFSAGILPNGVIRVDRVSGRMTEDQLRGLAIPLGADGAPPPATCAGGVQPHPSDTTPSGDSGELVNNGIPILSTYCLLDQSIIGPGGALCFEEPNDFFYEVVADGRGDDPAGRLKFRLFSNPWRNEGGFEWVLMLERVSEDRNVEGASLLGPDANIEALTLDD